ncbi:hypothetical protein EV363DRAFT_1278597 [Boletus edulis]|nr:hypothetical protein EV363DRAFT_1278597 [Boletus edulis]
MRTIRPLLGQVHFHFVLFATFALAALRNVTVDDAVLTGTVVPQYLPSASAWHQGNNCTVCAAKPDPSMVYDGTWHDTTYSPPNGTFKSIEFSFTGHALYIYFILANAPNFLLSEALTSVYGILNGVTFPPYIHSSIGNGYQYNVAVFANDSLTSGTHTMTVQPFVPADTGNRSILMLFDYLIYTTDTLDVVPTTSMSSVMTATRPSTNPSAESSTSPTSPVASGMSSGQNIGAIVGGTVAGVSAFALRRIGGPYRVAEPVVDPFVSPRMAPTSFESSLLPIHQTPVGSHPTELGLGSGPNTSGAPVNVQPSTPHLSANTAVSGSSSSNVTSFLEQITSLRGEVARLRERQDRDPDRDFTEFGSEAPPEYT